MVELNMDGKLKTITLIPGDGIGPEITHAVREVFQAAQVPVTWEEYDAGETAFKKTGELLPQELLESIRRNGVALKGPVTTPVGSGFSSVNVQLRKMFNLFANVRPALTTAGIKSRYTDVDLVIFRENTEGLYSGLETFDAYHGIADALDRVSIQGSERIVRYAFEYMVRHKRKRLTLVHKANILKKSSGLFLETGRRIAQDYPQITFDDCIVDNMAMQLVTYPEKYDGIVTTNLFGDILSDLCAGLVGGLGVVPGANMGKDCAIFEAVHGSAPDIAGQDKANPTALIRSAILMLYHVGLGDHARKIDKALRATLAQNSECTRDLGGNCGTQKFTQNVISHLHQEEVLV